MVERTDAVPVLAHRPVTLSPAQGGSVLSLPSGDVAADLRRIGGSRRRGTYELRVVNGSQEAIAAYTYVSPVLAGARVWQGALVPARSSVAVMVYVPEGPRSGARPLVAEVHAAGTRLTIGAPPRKPTRLSLSAKWIASAAALATLSVLFILWLGADSGTGPMSGSSATPHVIVRFVPLPATLARTPSKRAALAPLRIDKFHAPGSVRSGQSVRIDYRTAGDVGNVALVDEFGKTLARTALDSSGSSVLMVPNVATPQDLDVVVAARRGSERTSVSAPLLVRPAERATPHPQSRATSHASSPAERLAGASDSVESDTITAPIDVAPLQRVGKSIVVRVLAHPRDLHVALFAGGTPLAERDVPAADRSIVFPALSKPRALSLITTYQHGSGEESTISTLSVR